MLATINWKPTNKQMKTFGLVFMIGFALIGGVFKWKGWDTASISAWSAGGLIGTLAILAPKLAKPFYLAWMGLAFVMGTLVSALIITIIFYGIITPIALVMRLAGRDVLALKRKKGQTSYWVEHPALTNKSYYDRLF